MGPQVIPDRDRQALGRHTAVSGHGLVCDLGMKPAEPFELQNVRNFFTGPALGLLLAATLWLLLFSHFVYHSKYIATWTAAGLLGGALAALALGALLLWAGAVW